jgi:hypothetical protein
LNEGKRGTGPKAWVGSVVAMRSRKSVPLVVPLTGRKKGRFWDIKGPREQPFLFPSSIKKARGYGLFQTCAVQGLNLRPPQCECEEQNQKPLWIKAFSDAD